MEIKLTGHRQEQQGLREPPVSPIWSLRPNHRLAFRHSAYPDPCQQCFLIPLMEPKHWNVFRSNHVVLCPPLYSSWDDATEGIMSQSCSLKIIRPCIKITSKVHTMWKWIQMTRNAFRVFQKIPAWLWSHHTGGLRPAHSTVPVPSSQQQLCSTTYSFKDFNCSSTLPSV